MRWSMSGGSLLIASRVSCTRVLVGCASTRATVRLSLIDADRVFLSSGAGEDEFVCLSYSDGKIRVWDLKSGLCVRELKVRELRVGELRVGELGVGAPVSMLRPGPDGTRIAAWSAWKGRVWVWELETGRRQKLGGPQGRVKDLSWGADGKSLVAVSDSGAVQVWDVERGEVLRSLKAAADCTSADCIMLCPDERLLMFEGSKKIKTYNRMRSFASLQSLPEYQPIGNELMWNAKANLIIRVSHFREKIWEVNTGKRRGLAKLNSLNCTHWQWAPDGKRIAGWSRSEDRAWVWEAETGR
eukprot:63918-Hanusia_phi.AAC.1